MAKTGLWWDMCSCEFPSYFPPSLALHVAPSLLHNFALDNSNGCVITNAYSYKQNKELQNTLNKAGFKLQIIPSGSEKEKIEKTMVGDVTLWTTKNPPPANIIMLLGSSNMKNALRKLHYKGYKILICNSNFNEIYKDMLRVCHKHISWSHFLSSLLNEYEILRGFVQNGNCKIPLSSFADSSYSFMESKICSRDHVRPGFSSKNECSDKSLGLEEFKAWLVETVGSEKYRVEGYDILGIPRDFLNSTGMRLQLELLGCSKLIELVQLCNDVVTLVRLRHSYFVVFPRGREHGYKAMFPRPQEHANSVVPSPQGYLNLQGRFKATMLQFHGFICRMMLLGDFSKGLLLCALAKKFEERSGLLLDFKDLDYARLSDLVATCSVVAIQSDGPDQSLVIFSAEGKMYIKQIGKNGKDTKPIALKTDPANVVSVNSDSKRKHLFVEYTEKESNSVKLPHTEANEGKINVPMNIFPSECFGRQPGNVVKNVATSKVSSAKSTVQKSGNVVKDVAASLVTSSESTAYQSGNFAVANIIVNATSAGLPTKEKFCISATSSSREQISLKTTNTGNQKSTLKTNTGNQKPITLKTNTANLVSVNSDTKGKPYFVEYTEGGSGSAKLPCTEGKMHVPFNISTSECIIRQPGNLVKDVATSRVSSVKSSERKSGNVVKDVATSLVTSVESIARQSGNFAVENTIVNVTSARRPTKENPRISATGYRQEEISCISSKFPIMNAKSTVQKSGNVVKDVAAPLVTSSESSAYQSRNFAVGNIIVNATSAGLPTKDKFCISATSSSREQISLKTNTGNQKSTLKTNTGNQKPVTLKTNTANLVSVNSDTKGKPYFVEYTEGGSGYVKLPCTEGKMHVPFNISTSECIIQQPGSLVKDVATSRVSSVKSTERKSGNVVKDVATSLVTSAEPIARQSGNFAVESTIVNATSARRPTKEKPRISATGYRQEEISCISSKFPIVNARRPTKENPNISATGYRREEISCISSKFPYRMDHNYSSVSNDLRIDVDKDDDNAGWWKLCLNFVIPCLTR